MSNSPEDFIDQIVFLIHPSIPPTAGMFGQTPEGHFVVGQIAFPLEMILEVRKIEAPEHKNQARAVIVLRA